MTQGADLEEYESPPLWQLASRYNAEMYERFSVKYNLVDVSSTIASSSIFKTWV
jgi:hypothetical protein